MAFPARALPRTLSPRVLRAHALRLKQWQCRQIASVAAATEYREPEPFVHEGQQTPQLSRQAKIRQAKPFSEFLTDNFDRQHDYLRISLTERCNLRCTYCMPEEGIQLSPNKDILTTAEIQYISALFVNQGVNKIRLTGGEPTVRKDIIPLMQQIGSLRSNGLKELALTTNGISLHRKLDDMVAAGLTGVNISLDTLDPFQFQILTRRQGFSAVMKSIERVKEMNRLGAGIKLKINCVMMRGLNDHQLLPFVEMTQNEDVEVRFIEYMPFGGNKWNKNKMMSYEDMLDAIRVRYPDIGRLKDARNDTSKTWQVPGFVGRVGFITSMTHNFCGSCNRLRITSDGNLKVCLHGETEVSLRDLLRKDHGGEPMDEEAFEAIRQLELDRRSNPGLQFDGEEGWMSKEQQLLDVIGAAVKRKKAKHAGIGQLENMKNRPMILIGDRKHAVPPPRPRHAQRNPITPANPWSQIPTHMLSTPTPGGFSQMRAYSSDSKSSADGGFVFQSLGPLFPVAPAPGRYSRPKERRAEDAAAEATKEKAPEVSNQKDSVSEGPLFVSAPEAEKSESVASEKNAKDDHSAAASGGFGMKEDPAPRTTSVPTTETPTQSPEQPTSATPRRGRERGLSKIRQVSSSLRVRLSSPGAQKSLSSSDDTKTRLASPFATELKTDQPSKNGTAQTLRDTKAWGLQEDEDTTPPATKSSSRLPARARQVKSKPASAPTADQTRIASADAATITDISSNRLTHVKSSGEAHMVDVGAKPHTRRVAIAVANVRVSQEVYDQIEQNANKKGDVLGVARIAGIMAAKRTSDIIPLCHPLAVTKAEVDVYLVPVGRSSSLWNGVAPKVAVQARVECVGPTGVEMEAMMAVQGAALTVYDMCKAIDKELIVGGAKVVYKAGGRSGVNVLTRWKNDVGVEKFGRNGELKEGVDVLLGRD